MKIRDERKSFSNATDMFSNPSASASESTKIIYSRLNLNNNNSNLISVCTNVFASVQPNNSSKEFFFVVFFFGQQFIVFEFSIHLDFSVSSRNKKSSHRRKKYKLYWRGSSAITTTTKIWMNREWWVHRFYLLSYLCKMKFTTFRPEVFDFFIIKFMERKLKRIYFYL